MGIEKLIKDYSQQFLLIAKDLSLEDIINKYSLRYQELVSTFLVVKGDKTYHCTRMINIINLLQKLDYDGVLAEIGSLPIPNVDLLYDIKNVNIEELLNWLNYNPTGIALLVDNSEDMVIAVLSNEILASPGLVDDSAFFEILTSTIRLSDDPRATFRAKVSAPMCPHCQQKNFFVFNPEEKSYFCPNCRRVVILK